LLFQMLRQAVSRLHRRGTICHQTRRLVASSGEPAPQPVRRSEDEEKRRRDQKASKRRTSDLLTRVRHFACYVLHMSPSFSLICRSAWNWNVCSAGCRQCHFLVPHVLVEEGA
jgi:hypothetical protein